MNDQPLDDCDRCAGYCSGFLHGAALVAIVGVLALIAGAWRLA